MVDIGGPSEPSGVNLNKPIEVDTYKTPPRKSLRQKFNIEQIPPQKLTLRRKATISPNVLGWKAAQKRKETNYEVEENIFKGLEGIAQTFLKMEESRSQTMLKLEAVRADGEFAMTKMKLKTQEMIVKEKRDNNADRKFAIMKLKLKTQEKMGKEKRESDERIAAQNISFQL